MPAGDRVVVASCLATEVASAAQLPGDL